VIGLVHVALVC